MRRLRRIVLAVALVDALTVAAMIRAGGDPLANAHPFIRRGEGCPLPPDFVA